MTENPRPRAGEDKIPDDIDLLQGSWSIVSLCMEGRELPASMFVNAGVQVNGNRFVSTGIGTQYEGTLELEPGAKPRQLTMRFDAGPESGNANLCIYEISGDVWKLCIATRGPVRPSSFVSTPGSGLALEILRRKLL